MRSYDMKLAAVHGAEPTPAVIAEFIVGYLTDHKSARRADIVGALLRSWAKAGGHTPDIRLQEMRVKKTLAVLQKRGMVEQVAPKVWTLSAHLFHVAS